MSAGGSCQLRVRGCLLGGRARRERASGGDGGHATSWLLGCGTAWAAAAERAAAAIAAHLGARLARDLEEPNLAHRDECRRDESDVSVCARDAALERLRVQLGHAHAHAVALDHGVHLRRGRASGVSGTRRLSSGGSAAVQQPRRASSGPPAAASSGRCQQRSPSYRLLEHLHRLDLALLLELREVDLHAHLPQRRRHHASYYEGTRAPHRARGTHDGQSRGD